MGFLVNISYILVRLLFMIWCSITFVLLLISVLFRKKINKQKCEVQKHFLYRKAGKWETFLYLIIEAFLAFNISFICYLIIYNVSDNTMKSIMSICDFTNIITVIPIIINITQQNGKGLSGWHIFLFLIGLVLSFINYLLNYIGKSHTYFSMNIAICIGLAVFCGFNIYINYKSGRVIKITQSNIRKDLFDRTPNIDIRNIDGLELTKLCEKYYSEFINYYNKVGNLKRIEYVTLYGNYKEYWYYKTAVKMKIFWISSLFFLSILGLYQDQMLIVVCIIFLIIYALTLYCIKLIDKSFLYRLAIRFFYCEWGYCLYYKDKKNSQLNCDFTGYYQLFGYSKYNKLIYTILNIAALSRAVAFSDKINNTSKIKILTNNMYELFNIYNDDNEDDWTKLLPLWITALFEFSVYNDITENIKIKLGKFCFNQIERQEISEFIYGFWVDMSKSMPNKGIGEFIIRFISEISMKSE